MFTAAIPAAADLPARKLHGIVHTAAFKPLNPIMTQAKPNNKTVAFRATLEEVMEADLVVHVRDAHHPDSAAQRADVLGVLSDLGLGQVVLVGAGG